VNILTITVFAMPILKKTGFQFYMQPHNHDVLWTYLLPASLIPPRRAGVLGSKLVNVPVVQPYMIVTTTNGATWEVTNGHAKLMRLLINTAGISVFRAPYRSARIPEDNRPIREEQLATEIKQNVKFGESPAAWPERSR